MWLCDYKAYGAHDVVYIVWSKHLIALCQITGSWH